VGADPVADLPASEQQGGDRPETCASSGNGGSSTQSVANFGQLVQVAPDGSWIAASSSVLYSPNAPSSDMYNDTYTPSPGPELISVFHPTAVPNGDWEYPSAQLYYANPSGIGLRTLTVSPDGSTLFAGDAGGYGSQGKILVWNSAGGAWDSGDVTPVENDAELDTPLAVSTRGVAGAGVSLAASGDEVLAGAPRLSVGGQKQAGAAYIWDKPAGGWVGRPADSYVPTPGQPISGGILPSHTLTPSDPQLNGLFGSGAAFSGDQIVLAAGGATVGGNANQGKLYVFRVPASGWTDATETSQETASDGAAGDFLATGDIQMNGAYGIGGETYASLALSGPYLFAGTPHVGKPLYAFAVKSTLTAEIASGSGSVDGGDIACPSICSGLEWPGDTVTLTATPAAGFVFSGWSGGGCTGTGTCTVTMNGDQSVTAQFAPEPEPEPESEPSSATPTGSASGGGSVPDAPVGATSTPAAPDTTIRSLTLNRRHHSATFRFASRGSVVASGFRCGLARGVTQHAPHLVPCRSPRTYTKLAPGSYTFFVAAIGPGGADPTPARRTFVVKR
jgi:uncharacterized repeat protein (TIGR02543 family)